jgi:NAD(P)-dependent dehydrogenase (short-subunit alcohol dehydrogenase family)
MTDDGGGDLEGYRVLVTGGGSGIGAACAERLAVAGALVTVCGRTQSSLETTAARINRAGHPGRVTTFVADVTKEDDVVRAVAAAGDGTTLDGVVANAGGGGAIAPYHLQSVDEFIRVLHLNVVGTMLLVKHSVPLLVASGHGSFVAMSSIAGHVTHPYFGAYTVSKAGIEEMMRNAADEYGPANVRFNAVRPGFTATELMAAIPRDSAVFASYIANTPLEGVADPADVAELVVFLLGPGARWITGQIVNVDGGHSLRRGPDFSSLLEPVLGRDAMLAKAPPPPLPS